MEETKLILCQDQKMSQAEIIFGSVRYHQKFLKGLSMIAKSLALFDKEECKIDTTHELTWS